MKRALALAAAALASCLVTAPAAASGSPPRTGFELSDGARWTTQSEERRFLTAVDRTSRRVTVSRIGTTKQDRPLRLVRGGTGPAHPTPLLRQSLRALVPLLLDARAAYHLAEGDAETSC